MIDTIICSRNSLIEVLNMLSCSRPVLTYDYSYNRYQIIFYNPDTKRNQYFTLDEFNSEITQVSFSFSRETLLLNLKLMTCDKVKLKINQENESSIRVFLTICPVSEIMKEEQFTHIEIEGQLK